jgi:hypothetical protein
MPGAAPASRTSPRKCEQLSALGVLPAASAVPVSTSDLGYTGSAGNKITAVLPTPTAAIVLASFTSYFVPKFIPTTLTLPCSGTATVSFIPSPASSTAKPRRSPSPS